MLRLQGLRVPGLISIQNPPKLYGFRVEMYGALKASGFRALGGLKGSPEFMVYRV